MKLVKMVQKGIIFILFSFYAISVNAQNIFVVDNIGDLDNGAAYTAGNGTNTLRKCIRLANSTANSGGNDVIRFSASLGASFTIVCNDFPDIIDAVTIDGYTASGYTCGNPKVTIDASNIGFKVNNTNANGSIFQGLIINSCNVGIRLENAVQNIRIRTCWFGIDMAGTAATPIIMHGIQLDNARSNIIGGAGCERNVIGACNQGGIALSSTANDNQIINCIIGLDPTGLIARPNGMNGNGINIDNSTGNIVRNNIISANQGAGINNVNNSHNTAIHGNIIGLGVDGVTALGNGSGVFGGGHGVYVENSNDVVIGGGSYLNRNIVSGNYGCGIQFYNSLRAIVKGNFIGLDKNGSATPKRNGSHGVWLRAGSHNALIGGSTPVDRNVASGNGPLAGSATGSGNGISMDNSNFGTIIGNYAGTDSTGLIAVYNFWGGVSAWQSNNITIGGSNPGEGNVISGNLNEGLYLGGGTTDVTIYGNKIGVGSNGTTVIGNEKFGVNIEAGANQRIRIGGIAAGQGNIIAFNGYILPTPPTGITANQGPGVRIDGGTANLNSIRGNSIYCNGGKGIALIGGSNMNIQPPSSITSSANSISGAAGSVLSNQLVDVYRNVRGPAPAGCDCEGQIYLGTVVAAANGSWTLTHNLGLNATEQTNLSATRTDLNAPVPNTSEFSPCAAPLPVEFISFNATLKNEIVELDWSTSWEYNNDHFEIEKSLDGITFTKIGTVDSKGNSHVRSNYTFSDQNFQSGLLTYYRLKQVDANGQYVYSEIKVINEKSLEVNVYPNPLVGEITILASTNSSVYSKIYDISGKIVAEFSGNTSDLSNLSRGVYFIEIQIADTKIVKKLIKE